MLRVYLAYIDIVFRGRRGCYTNSLKRASSVLRLLAEIAHVEGKIEGDCSTKYEKISKELLIMEYFYHCKPARIRKPTLGNLGPCSKM